MHTHTDLHSILTTVCVWLIACTTVNPLLVRLDNLEYKWIIRTVMSCLIGTFRSDHSGKVFVKKTLCKNGKWCELSCHIWLGSDDVNKHSNAWQQRKVSHWAKLFIPSWRGLNGFDNSFTAYIISASHFKKYRGSDKCVAVFRLIDDLTACFCMGRYLYLEPILPVATPIAALWRSTCKSCGW